MNITANVIDDLKWDERGLLPAVVQDTGSGGLLMLAWMNAEALEHTLRTGLAHFYSRSRGKLWMKGETSGNTLAVHEVRYDCDADAFCVVAEPAGPTCHTGRRSCFYRRIHPDRAADGVGVGVIEDQGPPGPPVAILPRLEAVLHSRRDGAGAGKSYTKSLLDGGMTKILAKIAEQHEELAAELPSGNTAAVVHEAADLFFHVMVGLVARDISVDEVWRELGRRFGVGGHEEKAARGR